MTTTRVVTLTDFLLARIAEDEAVARAANGGGPLEEQDANWTMRVAVGPPVEIIVESGAFEIEVPLPETADHIARHDIARVLAECEAKRRIVEEAFSFAAEIDSERGCVHEPEEIRAGYATRLGKRVDLVASGCYGPKTAARILKPLASVYADHSDYDPAWAGRG